MMSCSVKCVVEFISQRKLYYHKPHGEHRQFSFCSAFVYDLVSGKLVGLPALHRSSPHKGVVVVRHAVQQGALLLASHLSSSCAQKPNGIHKTFLKIYLLVLSVSFGKISRSYQSNPFCWCLLVFCSLTDIFGKQGCLCVKPPPSPWH